MKVIVCVDDNGGMMFNKRRVSKDRTVCADIANDLGGRFLYTAEYSRSLFVESRIPFIATDGFLDDASDEDVCFVEDRCLLPYAEKIDEITIYRWNRRYPSDLKLDIAPEDMGLTLKETKDFQGYSHEKITKETYAK